jgi:outer membrane protein
MRQPKKWLLTFVLPMFLLTALSLPILADDTPQPLRLNFRECVRLSIEKSPHLGQIKARIGEAEARIAYAKSGYNPTLSIDASETYVDPVQTLSLSLAGLPASLPAMKLTEPFTSNAQMNLKQVLSTFGRTQSAVQVAQFNLAGIKEDYQKERDQVILESRKACLEVLRAEELVKVAQSTFDSASEYLRIAKARFNAGVAAHYDVTRAEVAVNRAEQNRIAAANARDMAKSQLLSLLDMDLSMPMELDEKLSYSPRTVNLEEGEERALSLRPEIKRMDRIIDMAGAAIRLATSDYNPNLLFVSSYARRTETMMTTGQLWQASMLLNIPVYDGGATNARVTEAKAALMQALEARRGVERGIRLEVRQIYLKLNESIEMLTVAEKNVGEAREGHRVAQFRFTAGVGASIEVTDALNQLTIAETSYLQALYNCQLAIAEWERATARLDEGGYYEH